MQTLINTLASLVSKHFPKEGSTYPSGWDGWSDFIAECKAQGFSVLGNGYFSAAFSHDSMTDKVIKVGFKKEDSGAAYAAYCRMNQGKAGIPNVYDIARHERCYTVVMDWLQPYEDNGYGFAQKAYSLASSALYGHDRVEEFDWSADAATVEIAEARYEFAKALQATAQEIGKFFKGIAEFDLHSGNVMLDAAGNLVITDPVSFSSGIAGWDAMDETVLVNERERIFKERCKARHENKLNKPALRKAERKRKAQAYKQRKQWREEAAARNADSKHWKNQVFKMQDCGRIQWPTWMDNGMKTLQGIAKVRREVDRKAIQMAWNLPIDDLMQARLMG